MSHGKSIELFFVNGTADDVVTAELSNWNAQAIRIPRLECRNPNHEHIVNALQGVGVYFLVCQNDGGKEDVYVGEAENVHKRLCEHLRAYDRNREIYYWNYAIAFVGGRLDKALIRYLENRLVAILKECGRCDSIYHGNQYSLRCRTWRIWRRNHQCALAGNTKTRGPDDAHGFKLCHILQSVYPDQRNPAGHR